MSGNLEIKSAYEERLQSLVNKFKRERGDWEKVFRRVEEENSEIRHEFTKRMEDFEKERKSLKSKLSETDEKLQEAGIQKEKIEYELEERKKEFALTMAEHAEKIDRMKTKMLEGVKSIARRMAKREAQWTTKFRAVQGEIKAMINEKKEEDVKIQIRKVDQSLEDIDTTVQKKINEIKKEMEKDSEDFWKYRE